MKEIRTFTARKLAEKIKQKEISVAEAVQAALEQIGSVEGEINSFVTLDEEGAMKQAARIQKEIDSGELRGPLAGVPAAVKDNLCVEGLPATCSSRILENFVPPYTAEAVLNLKKAGAVILGKTNMDEFAMGSTTETSAFGITRNPWNTDYVPGGSSGGSCAAVAAGECFYALGSDTGGSIRQPASFCGVTGLKPTYGTVSRYGLIAYGSSLDQIGPVAKDVADCAAILEAIASYDKKDSTSLNRKDRDFTAALKDDVKGMKIGIPRDYLGEGLEPDIKAAVLAAAKALEEKGAFVEEFDLSLVEYVYKYLPDTFSADHLSFSRFPARWRGQRGRGDWSGSPCGACHKNQNFLRLLHCFWRSPQYPYLSGVHRNAGLSAGVKPAGGGIRHGGGACSQLFHYQILQI